MLCRLPDCRHNRCRCRQHKGTGAKYNQNSNRCHNIAGSYVCSYSDQKSDRNKIACTFIGNALHGRLLILRFLHHVDQLLHRTVFSHLCRFHIDSTKTIECTAKYCISLVFIDGKGFPCHNRLIHRCFPADDPSIYRYFFTGKHSKDIPFSYFSGRYDLFPAVR